MAFKILKCNVLISKYKNTIYSNKDDVYEWDNVKTITTSESYELIINTATITIPKGVTFLDWDGEPRDANEIFDKGDSVEIRMWYERTKTDSTDDTVGVDDYTSANRTAIFTGYIADIQVGNIITMRCEDEMYAYKQKYRNFPGPLEVDPDDNEPVPEGQVELPPRSIGWEFVSANGKEKKGKIYPDEVTLQNVVNSYVSGIEVKWVDEDATEIEPTYTIDMGLGKFKTENASLTQILDELKKTYNVVGYFRNKVLYIGTFSNPNFQRDINFTFGIDIINDNNLIFQKEDDVLIKVSVVAIFPNNVVYKLQKQADGDPIVVKTQRSKKDDNGKVVDNTAKVPDAAYFIGDDNGSLRTFFLYYTSFISDEVLKQNMLQAGENELKRYKYTGWKGKFETFGESVVYPGDTVNIADKRLTRDQSQITDPITTERDGEYIVRSVDRVFDASSPKFRQVIELGPKIQTT